MKEFLHDLRVQLDYIKCNVRIHVTFMLSDIALTFT